MATVAEVLAAYGSELTEDDVATELAGQLGAMPGAAAAPLTAAELAYISDHAGGGAADLITNWDPTAAQRRREAAAVQAAQQLLTGTCSIERAAELLGVARTRISHRIGDGTLYAVTVGGRKRIPLWQIHDGKSLPGLPTVVAAIPAGAHPLDVEGIMTTPQDELSGRTPIDHLAGNGDPQLVADLVADLSRW